jgi:two-component system cell cycle response regulator
MAARLLVVEDNPTNLELMSYLLRAFGYPYITAQDGQEAVEMARRESPDLIICDIQLPRLDGYQVVRLLKSEAQFRDTPMIAVTALAMMGDRDRVLASGFNGYIAKPIQPDTFVSQVEEFLTPAQKSGVRLNSEPPARAEPGGPTEGSKGFILVIDDNPENLSLARGILEPYGYRVITAGGVSEAVTAATGMAPDLILSDVHLGDGTGFDIWGGIRHIAHLKEVPFILISSSQPSREERLQASAQHIKIILRPIESALLLQEIESRLPDNPGQESEAPFGEDSRR